MQLAFNLLGILVVFGICWLLSWQRKSINWKLIGKAFAIQLLLAVFIVKVPLGQQVISILSDGVTIMGRTQTAQAMAIEYGLLENGEKKAAFEVLLDIIHEADDHLDTGCLGARIVFHVLAKF